MRTAAIILFGLGLALSSYGQDCYDNPSIASSYPVYPVYGMSEVVFSTNQVETHSQMSTQGYYERLCYNFYVDGFLYENTSIITSGSASSSSMESSGTVVDLDLYDQYPESNTVYTLQTNHWITPAFTHSGDYEDPFGYSLLFSYATGRVGDIGTQSYATNYDGTRTTSSSAGPSSYFVGTTWAQDQTNCEPLREDSYWTSELPGWSGYWAVGFYATLIPQASQDFTGRTVREDMGDFVDGCWWDTGPYIDEATLADLSYDYVPWTIDSSNSYDSPDYASALDVDWVYGYQHTIGTNPRVVGGSCTAWSVSQTMRINSCTLPQPPTTVFLNYDAHPFSLLVNGSGVSAVRGNNSAPGPGAYIP